VGVPDQLLSDHPSAVVAQEGLCHTPGHSVRNQRSDKGSIITGAGSTVGV
jgi:hypothetical protein